MGFMNNDGIELTNLDLLKLTNNVFSI